MRFTNGYAANPVCSPTRYSLMTGKYPTRVMATNFFSGKRSGKFNPAPLHDRMDLDEITLAEILKKKGYGTFFAGKWHLGPTKEFWPKAQGFDINMGGWAKGGPYTGKKYFSPFKNPELHPDSPEGEHLPNRLADETTKFIRQNKENPFLAYLSFYSVHTPLQGRKDLVEKYKKRAAGISGEEFGPLHDRKVRILQKHAVYAAMVEAMDEAIGKVLTALEDARVTENTMVVFTSDNGAEASGPEDHDSFAGRRGPAALGYHTDYERLGLKGSYNTISPSFASAAVSPLAYYKFYAGEGGMRVPLIVAGASLPVQGELSHAFSFVTDITPTVLAFAGVVAPDARYGGRSIEPMIGRDLGPVLRQEAQRVYGPKDSVGYELAGHAVLFQGDYKIVFHRTPLSDGQWHLYNIMRDPGETEDLSSTEPARLQRMLSAYERYTHDNKVLPVPPGFDNYKQLVIY